MEFFDRYSFLVISAALLAFGIVFALIAPFGETIGIITFLVGAALVIFWVTARRGALTPVNPAKRIRRGRQTERPVVVCFYHDFNFGSLFSRIFTAKAEREEKGHCDFIYIDAFHREAPAVLEEFEAEVGDWLLFDAAGKLVEKCGRISVEKIEALRKQAM